MIPVVAMDCFLLQLAASVGLFCPSAAAASFFCQSAIAAPSCCNDYMLRPEVAKGVRT
jgi:hypothetical protein